MDLKEGMDFYFGLCDTVTGLKGSLKKDELLDVRLETFIRNPERELREICLFLGEKASDQYLKDCAGIVFDSPRKTRFQAPWKKALIDLAMDRMAFYPYLKGYAYEEND
jgi:hypothetical protein